MTEKSIPNGTRLWDEILKAIVDAMPEQLFSLFKEVFGKEYPKGTPIILLGTESSTYQENTDAPPSSRLSDIALLVNGTDYYHLECQMHNDQDMVIRMVAYDLHFAMQHTAETEQEGNGVVMRFPRSVVIYPEKNRKIPESLHCRIIFQDGSEHFYQIPTVRIQSYSLEEIHEKHLNLFIPYVLLRLRPRLRDKIKNPLTRGVDKKLWYICLLFLLIVIIYYISTGGIHMDDIKSPSAVTIGELSRIVKEFEEKIQNGTEDPNRFLTLTEIEELWGRLIGDTNVLYSDMVQSLIQNIDERGLVRQKKENSRPEE